MRRGVDRGRLPDVAENLGDEGEPRRRAALSPLGVYASLPVGLVSLVGAGAAWPADTFDQ
jgi:hypothetical protein